MNDFLKFKSNFPLYRKTLGALILIIVVINLVFAKYINVISFFNLFILIVPNLIITIIFYKLEIKRIQKHLKEHMENIYPEKLKFFLDNYHNDSNPGSKPIFALFTDKELLKDNLIITLKTESEKFIFLLVSVSAITIMVFLISTVFILRARFMS